MCGEGVAKPVGERKASAVFERLYETIEREGVAPCRNRAIERRRFDQTGAAQLIVGTRFGTLRTGGGELRQAGGTIRAYQRVAARSRAQHAVLREQRASQRRKEGCG